MLYPVNAVGEYGLMPDRPPHESPSNVWTDGRNVQFRNGSAEKMLGSVEAFDGLVVAPIYAATLSTDTSQYWVYAGLNKVYCWDNGVHTNITRRTAGVDVDYAATQDERWTGGALSGVLVLNNSFDPPQMWYPPSPSTRLTALANWPANTTCGAIRVFKQFLIAMDVTKSGTRYPHLVFWSHPADSGTPPSSWNIADPTKLAGETPVLSETPGFVVDGASLRDTFVIYKEDSVWGMQLVGGVDVFRFYKIFNNGGILAKNCVVEFQSGKHAVFGISDIYYHDGQQMVSIVQERARQTVYSRMNQEYFQRAFVAHDEASRTVWFCYPTGANTECDEALVWSYESDTLAFRDLSDLSFIATGIVSTSASDQWATDSAGWDTDSTTWSQRFFNPMERKLAAFSFTNQRGALLNTTEAELGLGMNAFLLKTGIALPIRSSQPPDVSYRKFVRAVWVRITGTPNAEITIEVGSQDDSYSEVFWQASQKYIIGQTQRIDCRVSGRLFAIRLSCSDTVSWQLHGYEMEYESMGRY